MLQKPLLPPASVGVLPLPLQVHASQNKRHVLAGVYTVMGVALILANLDSDGVYM